MKSFLLMRRPKRRRITQLKERVWSKSIVNLRSLMKMTCSYQISGSRKMSRSKIRLMMRTKKLPRVTKRQISKLLRINRMTTRSLMNKLRSLPPTMARRAPQEARSLADLTSSISMNSL